MSRDKEGQQPYARLGEKLRRLRELNNETLAEVCGAVEIDIDQLEQIETGSLRPSEDILFLLSQHFKSSEKQAAKLFSLAGYLSPDSAKDHGQSVPPEFTQQPAMMVFPVDARVLYSDAVNISANDHGIVFSFMQNTMPAGKQVAVSRVGMSHEHAKNMLKLLEKTLHHVSEPKQLEAGQPKPSQKKKISKQD